MTKENRTLQQCRRNHDRGHPTPQIQMDCFICRNDQHASFQPARLATTASKRKNQASICPILSGATRGAWRHGTLDLRCHAEVSLGWSETSVQAIFKRRCARRMRRISRQGCQVAVRAAPLPPL